MIFLLLEFEKNMQQQNKNSILFEHSIEQNGVHIQCKSTDINEIEPQIKKIGNNYNYT